MQYMFQIYDEMQFDYDLLHIQNLKRSSNFVPGSGSLVPRAILVGEAPGANENRERRPFVGRSGVFLEEVLVQSGMLRSDLFITNVVKYQPPGNRDPSPKEIHESLPFLRRELALLGTSGCRLIVGMGKIACSALLGEDISVTNYRGNFLPMKNGWQLFVTYHPSFIIRSIRPGSRPSLVERQFRADFRAIGEHVNAQVK